MNEIELHHVGIQVDDMGLMTKFYKEIFEMQIIFSKISKHFKGHANLEILFLQSGSFIVELIGYKPEKNIEGSIHFALSVRNLSDMIAKLDFNSVKYKKCLNVDGSIDFITFTDPESNSIEISQNFTK
jgi:hypothetical protein